MPSKPQANVLVCVTDPSSCHRLILAGMAIAEQYDIPVKVVSIVPQSVITPVIAQNLQTLYNIAGRLGAEMTVYFNDEPALTAAVHARQTNAQHLVSGAPGTDSTFFLETVKGLLPEIPISIVDPDEQMYTFPALAAAQQPQR